MAIKYLRSYQNDLKPLSFPSIKEKVEKEEEWWRVKTVSLPYWLASFSFGFNVITFKLQKLFFLLVKTNSKHFLSPPTKKTWGKYCCFELTLLQRQTKDNKVQNTMDWIKNKLEFVKWNFVCNDLYFVSTKLKLLKVFF